MNNSVSLEHISWKRVPGSRACRRVHMAVETRETGGILGLRRCSDELIYGGS